MKVILIMLLSSSSYCAPAQMGKLCNIEGRIKTIEIRSDVKNKKYTDLQFDLKKVSGIECTKEFFKNLKFQLRFDEKNNKYKVGDCIEGLTQYSGDEYAHGQWVWNIKYCK